MQHCDHAHGPGHEPGEPPPSTGFLPISLAVALFVTGLFVLGLIPGASCHAETAAVDD